jgi:DNA-binding Lrp family transcriptional regulator
MGLTAEDRDLLAVLQDGLPLVAAPYAALAQTLGWSEAAVLGRLARLLDDGIIKRMGLVVRHRELGFRANAMVVWDVPDTRVEAIAHRLRACEFVTLCYQRRRQAPQWPYNLYCMIHGRDRPWVMRRVQELITRCGIEGIRHEVLFSTHRFKQCGAHYLPPALPADVKAVQLDG